MGQHVLAIENRNNLIIELHGIICDTSLASYKTDLSHNVDFFAEQNEETNAELKENNEQEVNKEGSSSDCKIDFSVSWYSSVPGRSNVNFNMRNLNRDQINFFNVVHKWARN